MKLEPKMGQLDLLQITAGAYSEIRLGGGKFRNFVGRGAKITFLCCLKEFGVRFLKAKGFFACVPFCDLDFLTED